ncbi:MAG: response regulator [Deltaproteobacteria bacterium]
MARILIIDDDETFRTMVRRMLESADYKEIEEAGDGNSGMNLLRNNPFDLVITDIIMPNKEGIELIMELTKNYPRIKIIAMSGGGKIGAESYLEMASHLGANRTIKKPFKQAELLHAVKELLT